MLYDKGGNCTIANYFFYMTPPSFVTLDGGYSWNKQLYFIFYALFILKHKALFFMVYD